MCHFDLTNCGSLFCGVLGCKNYSVAKLMLLTCALVTRKVEFVLLFWPLRVLLRSEVVLNTLFGYSFAGLTCG